VTYDDNDNLQSVTPPAQPTHGFSYDAADVPRSYTPPPVDGTDFVRSMSPNADLQPDLVTLANGRTIDYVRDDAGRTEQIVVERGTYSLAYNPSEGQLTATTTPDGEVLELSHDSFLLRGYTWSGTVSGSVELDYDDRFNLGQVIVEDLPAVDYGYDGDGLMNMAGALEISRDEVGQPESLVLTAGESTVDTQVGHNAYGELQFHSTTHDSDGAFVLFAEDIERDAVGRVSTRTETIEGVVAEHAYTYDSVGRLESHTVDGSTVMQWDYDENGNRISATGEVSPSDVEYDAQDRLLRYGNLAFEYDAEGHLVSRTDTSDASTTAYEYDELGNLLAATLPDGTGIDYHVDGLGRRVGKSVDGTLQWGLLYQDALNPVAMLDGAGEVTARFVYGTKPHVPQYMITDTATYRIISDQLGSVRLVVDAETGAVAQRIDYDPWGRILMDTNPGFQPFGFAGGLYDADTGLVRFGARDYDPVVGRWAAKDPILFEGGQANLYAYVENDPVNRIDPLGRFGVAGAAIGGAVGGVLGGAFGYATTGTLDGAMAGALAGGLGGAAAASGAALLGGTALSSAAGAGGFGAMGNYAGQFASEAFGLQEGINYWAVAGAGGLGAAGGAAGSALGGGTAGDVAIGLFMGPLDLAIGAFTEPTKIEDTWPFLHPPGCEHQGN
jgi:RHS repeat-associated protein